MKTLMVGISGVRGVVGEGLTPEVSTKFAAAFGTYTGRGSIVVGQDSRVSGKPVRYSVLAGLLSVGCDVIDLGICPTPTVQLMTESLKARGGIAITASHNPTHWNGIKFIGPDGIGLNREQGEELLQIYEQDQIQWAKWDRLGSISQDETAVEKHIERTLNLSYVDIDLIRNKRFRVVLDCCNGAGGKLCPQLLRMLGCEVIELNCKPTGLFAHDPEPIPDHLGDLCSVVKAHLADVGFALDPDGDRLSIVSNKGKPLGEEHSLAIATELILQKRKGRVVVNLSTTKAIDDIATEHGVPVIRTPVGEVYVAKCMKEVGAIIGGEGNGGVILPEAHFGRDAQVGMVLALQHLAEFDGTMAELAETIPSYHIVKKVFEGRDLDLEKAVDVFLEGYPDGKVDLTDGLKIIGNSWWIHLRKSNTEPTIRVIAEARPEEEATRLCDQALERLHRLTSDR